MFKNIPLNSQDVKDVKKSLSKLTHKPLYNKKIKNFSNHFINFTMKNCAKMEKRRSSLKKQLLR